MKDLLTPEQIENFPVRYLSMSAMRTYMENRQAFFRRYIRLIFDETKGPGMIEGAAAHKVLEDYWRAKINEYDFDLETSLNCQFDAIDLDNDKGLIDWGKTGDVEKSKNAIRQMVGFYLAEVPKVTEILEVEEQYTSDFEDLDGDTQPVALKGICDLITKEGDNIVIRDHKFVATIVESSESCPAYEIQAAAYWFLFRKKYGKNPAKMIFDQIKKSANRDKSPQVVPYVIEYTPALLERFLELYRRIVSELVGKPLIDPETGVMKFLPNPFAQFGGEDAWADFCEEVETKKVWNLADFIVDKKNAYADPDDYTL